MGVSRRRMLDSSSSRSASAFGSNILRHGAESVGTAAFCDRSSGLGMLVRSRKGSLFAPFSPKLWTVLNQYGAGEPCVMGLREWPPGIEFENLSLDQFKLEDAASANCSKLQPRSNLRRGSGRIFLGCILLLPNSQSSRLLM